MRSMLPKQIALKNQISFMLKVWHQFLSYCSAYNYFQIFVSRWLRPKTSIATDKIVSQARNHVNSAILRFFKTERKLERIPFAWSCTMSTLRLMNFNSKVRVTRLISKNFHRYSWLTDTRTAPSDRETFFSAAENGVCISNFTMYGMDHVEISNKLWIEKGKQKCLGRFSYPNLEFWLVERISLSLFPSIWWKTNRRQSETRSFQYSYREE